MHVLSLPFSGDINRLYATVQHSSLFYLIFSGVVHSSLLDIFWVRGTVFLFCRMSSDDIEPVVNTETFVTHPASYGIQNLRYIFQILTDAVAMR